MIGIWLTILVAAIIIEFITPTALVSIWFAAGALVAMVLEVAAAPLWLQIIIFFIVSILLLLIVRPLSAYYLRGNIVATNADRYIGAVGIVEKTITAQEWGIVKVEGASWSAIPYNCEMIEKGERVKVVAIEGAKLLVSALQE
ncbi:NfeD family protein [Merdibacter massiliensis]|uniref:NfeD family protein n=1 Tax=Merdibacter massiliensis TaxID=1871030 RepID=UPI00096A897C|nr:NfeD family protein [Merdibacter massiliensis]